MMLEPGEDIARMTFVNYSWKICLRGFQMKTVVSRKAAWHANFTENALFKILKSLHTCLHSFYKLNEYIDLHETKIKKANFLFEVADS